MAQHRGAGAGPKGVGVIDAVAVGQGRVNECHGLGAHVGVTRRVAQVDVIVEELAQAEVLGQGGCQDQAGVGDGVLVVEGHGDAVEAVK